MVDKRGSGGAGFTGITVTEFGRLDTLETQKYTVTGRCGGQGPVQERGICAKSERLCLVY